MLEVDLNFLRQIIKGTQESFSAWSPFPVITIEIFRANRRLDFHAMN